NSAARWAGRPDLYLARQCPGRHPVEVQHGFGDVLRLDLPTVCFTDDAIVEAGSHGARHNGGDADVVLSQVEHGRLAETNEAELAGVVRSAAGEEVDARQTADGDDHAGGLLKCRSGGLDREEGAGEVRIDHPFPTLFVQLVDPTVAADTGVGYYQIEPPEALDDLVDRRLLRGQARHIERHGQRLPLIALFEAGDH